MVEIGIINKEVGIDEIEPNEWNPNKMSELQYNSLKKSIIKYPRLLNADKIIVWYNKSSSKYIILDGEHRYNALVDLKYTKIPVALIEGIDLVLAKKIVLSLLNRGNINYQKKIDAIQDLLKQDYEIESITSIIGEDADHVSTLLDDMSSSVEDLAESFESYTEGDKDLDSIMDEMGLSSAGESNDEEEETGLPQSIGIQVKGIIRDALELGTKNNFKDHQSVIKRACKYFIEHYKKEDKTNVKKDE